LKFDKALNKKSKKISVIVGFKKFNGKNKYNAPCGKLKNLQTYKIHINENISKAK